jgi:hypothetical protein
LLTSADDSDAFCAAERAQRWPTLASASGVSLVDDARADPDARAEPSRLLGAVPVDQQLAVALSQRYRSFVLSLVVTLLTIALIAIPIVFVVKIVRRLQRVGFSDPARLQRAFAESAAAALRRAGAEPQAVAKLEVLGQRPAGNRAADLHAKAYESRIGLQRKGNYAVSTRPPTPAAPAPPRLLEDEPHPQPLRRRPRPRARPTQGPIVGLDMGESFRLSEPPDQGEPHTRVAISNWIAVALFAGAAAYYFLR